jgi:hypothetical protein
LNTVDSVDVNDPRPSQLTQSMHSHIIFAHNLHLAFLPRHLMTIPATDVPLSAPSLENEEDRIPKPVPPLVEDEERARWHAQVHRHRPRLCGFGWFKGPLLVIDGYRGTFIYGPEGEPIIYFTTTGYRESSCTGVTVCLHHVRIILPGHRRDPGDVDQICVERSPHTLLSMDVIDIVVSRFDTRITVTGFVDGKYVGVSLSGTDPLRK